MAYPKIMGSLLESMWSQRGVIATLTNGSGLSEWDLAESTPGTSDGVVPWLGYERVCFRRMSLVWMLLVGIWLRPIFLESYLGFFNSPLSTNM